MTVNFQAKFYLHRRHVAKGQKRHIIFTFKGLAEAVATDDAFWDALDKKITLKNYPFSFRIESHDVGQRTMRLVADARPSQIPWLFRLGAKKCEAGFRAHKINNQWQSELPLAAA